MCLYWILELLVEKHTASQLIIIGPNLTKMRHDSANAPTLASALCDEIKINYNKM